MRLVHDSATCAQLVHDDVHVVIWKAPPDVPSLDRTKAIGAELARANANGFWALTVIASGISIPDVSVQKKSAEVSKAIDASINGSAIVLPGEGFWVSAARSFLAGVTILSGARAKREVVSTIPDAARWLAKRSERDVAWADALVRELERSGALPG